MLTVVGFASVMVQTVFWQQMTVDMGVNAVNLTNAQSANLAGLALGCLFFIPFTVKYGRRPAYLLSTAVLAGSVWWASAMKTNAELIITAIITGLAGAINETAVQMTVRTFGFRCLVCLVLITHVSYRSPTFFSSMNVAPPTPATLALL